MRKALFLLLLLSFVNPNYAGYAATPPKVIPAVTVPVQAVTISPAPIVAQTPEPAKALTEADLGSLIHFEKTPIVLNSKLKKKYMAYKVTVKSDNHDPVSIQGASLTNGYVGTMAADSVHTSKGWAFISCVAGLPGFVIIGLPVMGVISANNGKSENEGAGFSNQVPQGRLTQGQFLAFNVLVPKGQTPQVNLTFKDETTGQVFSANSL